MSLSMLKMSLMSCRLCLLLLVVMTMLWSSEACFIRNCPRGGKRSIGGLEITRQCMSCGPGGAGQCVGPSICCGPSFGCLMGAEEAEVCQKENESSTPCNVKGRQCGKDDMGNCVADGLCCAADACSFNSLCAYNDREKDSTRRELLSFIRRLVDHQYD